MLQLPFLFWNDEHERQAHQLHQHHGGVESKHASTGLGGVAEGTAAVIQGKHPGDLCCIAYSSNKSIFPTSALRVVCLFPNTHCF